MSRGETEKLSPMRDYRDAVRLLKHTSRASNGQWYRHGGELPIQWHISIDGDHIESSIWKSKDNSWSAGPTIDIEQLKAPPERLAEVAVKEILKGVRRRDKRAVGIVLHLHNSFQLAEIRSEYSEVGEDIKALDELVRIAPASALSGSKTDTDAFSYSLLPFWGISASGRTGVAVQTTNHYRNFVELFTLWGEANNIPIKVAVTAAPLEALAQFSPPGETTESEEDNDGRIVIFRSRATSFIAVLNRDDELCSARMVANQANGDLPTNLKQLLLNCSESENIANPITALFDMTGNGEADAIAIEDVELIEDSSSSSVPVEFLNAVNSPEQFAAGPFNENQTFSQLTDSWAQRNLYSLECQDPSRFPTQSTLRILKVSRMIRALLMLAIPVAIGWSTMSTIQNSQQKYWKVNKVDVVSSTEMVRKLNREKKLILYWENLLASRSEGWIPLTAILDLLPEEEGILLTDFRTSFYALPPRKRGKHLPMRQTWRAKGHATDKGMQHLISLSSKSNLSIVFDTIADWSESPVYLTEGDTRSLNVSLGQKQETMVANNVISKAMARHYRKGFEFEIDRDFSDKDDIALVIKPPSTGEPTQEP